MQNKQLFYRLTLNRAKVATRNINENLNVKFVFSYLSFIYLNLRINAGYITRIEPCNYYF